MKSETTVETVVQVSKEAVERAVRNSKTLSSEIIARYTAAIAVNFTDWLGKSLPWVRHELAYHTLVDNLRCESVEDHVGMLLRFARLCNVIPTPDDYRYTEDEVRRIRELFQSPVTAGLSGLVLCMVLENTSEIFIPDLERRGMECGCDDFTYTDAHGVADVAHSRAFLKAVEAEQGMGYRDSNYLINFAADTATDLIVRIYS